MNTKKQIILVAVAVLFMVFKPADFAFALVSSSANYGLESDSVNTSGARSSSASYIVNGTVGGLISGNSSGSSYGVESGYQQTSASAASPTPSVVTTTVGGGGIAQDRVVPIVHDLNIVSTENSAVISWKTQKASLANVYWGISPDKIDNLIPEKFYLNDHLVEIKNLKSGSKYFFKLDIVSSFGNKNIVTDYFTTPSFASRIDDDATDLSVEISEDEADLFLKSPIIENLDQKIQSLTVGDFEFIQDGKRIAVIDGVVKLDKNKNFTILLDYEKTPEILKTIAVSFEKLNDDSKKSSAFLLKINKDKSAYSALIPAFGEDAEYLVNIVVLDHKNQGMKKLDANLFARDESVKDLRVSDGVKINLFNLLKSVKEKIVVVMDKIIYFVAYLWFKLSDLIKRLASVVS